MPKLTTLHDTASKISGGWYPIVTFSSLINHWCVGLTAGMRGRLVDVSKRCPSINEIVYRVSTEEFIEHNSAIPLLPSEVWFPQKHCSGTIGIVVNLDRLDWAGIFDRRCSPIGRRAEEQHNKDRVILLLKGVGIKTNQPYSIIPDHPPKY